MPPDQPSQPSPTPPPYMPPPQSPNPTQPTPPITNPEKSSQPNDPNKPILDTTAFSMEEVDKDERLISVIKKHFFGIFIIYVQVIAALAIGIGLVYFLLPNFVDRSETEVYSIVGMISGIIVVLMAVILIIATMIYYNSRIILTDQNITQVLQIGLFNRKVSQLAVTNVEDVTAHKNGIFGTILDFGELNVETAGEQVNFVFHYCPKPDFYARQILEAREQARGAPRR